MDRQNYITKIAITKQTQERSLQGKGDGCAGVRTKGGEVKRGGREKTKTKDIAASTNMHVSRKGQWRREQAPCPRPTEVVKPRNQPLGGCLWAPNLQVGVSPMHTPTYRNLPLQPVPSRIFLGENFGRTEFPSTTQDEA